MLDCTVEALESAKDPIVDALSVPGTGVALDALIGILKKVQVCDLPVMLRVGAELTMNNRLRKRTAMHCKRCVRR